MSRVALVTVGLCIVGLSDCQLYDWSWERNASATCAEAVLCDTFEDEAVTPWKISEGADEQVHVRRTDDGDAILTTRRTVGDARSNPAFAFLVVERRFRSRLQLSVDVLPEVMPQEKFVRAVVLTLNSGSAGEQSFRLHLGTSASELQWATAAGADAPIPTSRGLPPVTVGTWTRIRLSLDVVEGITVTFDERVADHFAWTAGAALDSDKTKLILGVNFVPASSTEPSEIALSFDDVVLEGS